MTLRNANGLQRASLAVCRPEVDTPSSVSTGAVGVTSHRGLYTIYISKNIYIYILESFQNNEQRNRKCQIYSTGNRELSSLLTPFMSCRPRAPLPSTGLSGGRYLPSFRHGSLVKNNLPLMEKTSHQSIGFDTNFKYSRQNI